MFDNLTVSMALGMIFGAVGGYVLMTFRRGSSKPEGDPAYLRIAGYTRDGKDWNPIIPFRDQHYILRPDGAIEQTAQLLEVMEDKVDDLTCQRDNWKAIAELRSESLHKAIGGEAGLDHTEELR